MGSENKKLKIAIVSFDWRNIFENDFEQLKGKLKRDGLDPDFNDFFLISWSDKKYHKKIGNIETVHLKAPLGGRIFCDILSDFFVPFFLAKHSFRPDIILVYDFPLIFAGLFCKIFWHSKIVMFLGNLPSALAKTRKASGLRNIYQKLSEFSGKNLVDYFIVISQITEKYISDLGIPENRIKKIIPDVIERDRQFITSSKRGIVRKKFNIPEDKKILLSVGRLEPEKGFDELIEIFGSLERNDFILLITGEGSQKERLLELIEEKNLEQKVILAGYQDRANIWNYYQDADIFILFSRSEGLGLVFWEAMFMGVPVIGAAIDGIKETIGQDGERGFYWENDLEELENKINICLDKESKEKIIMIERAKEYVEQKNKSRLNINNLINGLHYF